MTELENKITRKKNIIKRLEEDLAREKSGLALMSVMHEVDTLDLYNGLIEKYDMVKREAKHNYVFGDGRSSPGIDTKKQQVVDFKFGETYFTDDQKVIIEQYIFQKTGVKNVNFIYE
jgi:hypothetical protein